MIGLDREEYARGGSQRRGASGCEPPLCDAAEVTREPAERERWRPRRANPHGLRPLTRT
ncbi:MAG: hypothetical protein PVSMB4_11930 [Ktedonobacterales bacterium]